MLPSGITLASLIVIFLGKCPRVLLEVMLVSVAKFVLFGSIFGIAFIVVRKMPALASLPAIEVRKLPERKSFLEAIRFFAFSFGKNFEEKIISSFKSLKKRNKEKFEEKEEVNFSDDYWEKIRKG